MKNQQIFRIVFFVFIFVEVVSCFVNLLTNNVFYRDLSRLISITVNIFACWVLYYHFKDKSKRISTLFLIITCTKVVETIVYLLTMVPFDTLMVVNTIKTLLFCVCFVEYILLWIVGLRMNTLGNTRTVKQAGIAIVIQINVDSLLVVLGFFILPMVFDYSNKLLITRGFLVTSAIFMIYMLYFVQKLFAPYVDDLDDLDEIFKKQDN
jgi:hypothetical protein